MSLYFTDDQVQQAKQNGIPYNILYSRVIEYGWDFERAITTPVQNKFGHSDQMKIPKKYVEEAQKNGVNHSALLNRVYRYGWDLKKAVTTPLAPRKRRRA